MVAINNIALWDMIRCGLIGVLEENEKKKKFLADDVITSKTTQKNSV